MADNPKSRMNKSSTLSKARLSVSSPVGAIDFSPRLGLKCPPIRERRDIDGGLEKAEALHTHNAVARIYIDDLSRDPTGQVTAKKRSGIPNFCLRNGTLERCRLFNVMDHI